MLCPRCNTELPDSASVCTRCGSTVFAAAPMQAQAPGFSYLPPGAPRWPTTGFPHTPYAPPGQTQGAPTSVALGPGDRDNLEPEPPRRKRSSLSVPFMLLLLLGSILVGGGLTYGVLALQNAGSGPQQPKRVFSLTPAANTTPGAQSSTPTATGNQLPTPVSFQRTVSSELGFSMQFPSDWVQDKTQQISNGNKNIVFHPSTQLPVTLLIAQISAANSAQATGTSEINSANIQGFGSANNLPSPQLLTNAPTSRSIGGVSWAEEDAVFAPSGGLSIHVVSLAVKHKVYYYNIVYFAPTSAYDEAMAKYYTKMLNSFQFTS